MENPDNHEHSAHPVSQQYNPPFRTIKTILTLATIVGLAITNILTLVNDTAHALGYAAIRGVLNSIAMDATTSRLLRNSPTNTRKEATESATQSLRQRLASLGGATTALAEKHVALGDAHAKLGTQYSTLMKRSKIQAATVSRISKSLARRSAITATRNLSSIPAEAIPMIGTAVILSVTALDLNDACETLKEVNELNATFEYPQEVQTTVCGMKVPTKEEVFSSIKENGLLLYRATASTLNAGGGIYVPIEPPTISLNEFKSSACSVIGTSLPLCL